jgi:ABC-type nitrate/sulfonate/bicarbonate transport system permease component
MDAGVVLGSRVGRTGPAWRLRATAKGVLSYGVSITIFIALWEAWSDNFGVPQLFPPPWRTAHTFAALIADGSLPHDTMASMARILAGFAMGSLLGAALGLLIGSSRLIRDLVDPYVNFLRFISGVAWISIFIVWLGIGEASKIALIVYTTAFAVALNTVAGVAAITPNKLRAARCFGSGPAQRFFWVTLPATVPHIVTGMRLSLSNAFLVIVAAEMVLADSGVGFMIISARLFLAPDIIFCGMIALGLLGLLSDRVLMLLARALLGRYFR